MATRWGRTDGAATEDGVEGAPPCGNNAEAGRNRGDADPKGGARARGERESASTPVENCGISGGREDILLKLINGSDDNDQHNGVTGLMPYCKRTG